MKGKHNMPTTLIHHPLHSWVKNPVVQISVVGNRLRYEMPCGGKVLPAWTVHTPRSLSPGDNTITWVCKDGSFAIVPGIGSPFEDGNPLGGKQGGKVRLRISPVARSGDHKYGVVVFPQKGGAPIVDDPIICID
jgi:hypothetical protein